MIVRLLQVFGGLALFLLGVNMLSKGMEKLAGNKIQDWLDRMTSTHIKGGIFGTVATALLQSSSMVMVTMISLINAKLMTLEQAISVMLGQEIGTTLTGQIAAFNMGDYFFIFLIAGLIMLEFTKKGEWKKYGEILMGFGVLFLGMQTMTSALKILMDLPAVVDVMAYMGQHVMLSVLAGTIATAIVQSSSAVTGLVVALGLAGSITLPGAVALLLGANIGTCFTGLIAASRLSKASLQASLAQIFINVVGVLIFLPFIHPFSNLVALTASQLGRQIANAHTIFNIAVSLLMYPFIGLIKKFVMKVIPIAEEENGRLTHYIDEGQLSVPSIAITEAFRELLLLHKVSIEMVYKASKALLDYDKVAVKWVLDKEQNYIDPVVDLLDVFINHLYLTDLDESQQKHAFQIKGLIVDVERIADLAENLAESAREKQKNDIDFSKYGDRSVIELGEYIVESLQLTYDALKSQDYLKAQKVIEREDEFDHLYMKARQRHIVRLKKKICKPNAEVIFLDTLHNFERISDHTENIAEKIIDQNAPAVVAVPTPALIV